MDDEPMVGTDTPEGDGDAGTDTEADAGDDTMTETEGGMETETDVVETTAGVPDLVEREGTTPEGIEVSDTELERDMDLIRVTGTVENTGDETFEEVEVQVTLLDDNDEIIGQFFHDTEEAEVESLEPDAQWEFSVDFPGEDTEDAAAYRVDVDTEIDDNVDTDIGGTDTPTGTATE